MYVNLNEYNICEDWDSEDWGWFVDTESLILVRQTKLIEQSKYNTIKFKNKLEIVIEKSDEENEYDYCLKNKKDLEDIENHNIENHNIENNNEICKKELNSNKITDYSISYFVNFCSKTIMTALITYLLIIIL